MMFISLGITGLEEVLTIVSVLFDAHLYFVHTLIDLVELGARAPNHSVVWLFRHKVASIMNINEHSQIVLQLLDSLVGWRLRVRFLTALRVED